ncbi:hypothetical protein [Paenibacillus guangzhouensis]|uniref:hypothetical protein n=1 Tax=Paenibacillus guangzhouensis TaxID=1473112 RepID=UPI00187B93B4|nr:hypothetical protein [Paenibacillus guangzhouensis]
MKLRREHDVLLYSILGNVILLFCFTKGQSSHEIQYTSYSSSEMLSPVVSTEDAIPITRWEITDLGPASAAKNEDKILQVTAIIDLGEDTIARAAATVQMQEVMFGGSMGRKFIHSIDRSERLTVTTTQDKKLVTNYVKGTVQSDHRLQISYNGYLEKREHVRQPFWGTGFIQIA